MAKKHSLEMLLKEKLREPKTCYLLGGGASFCAGLPGTFQLVDLLLSELQGVSRRTFKEIIRFLTDSGLENPDIEDILSELDHCVGGAGLAGKKEEQSKTTIGEVCQCIRNILTVDGPTVYHTEFMTRLVGRRAAEPAEKAPPVQIFTSNYDLLIELACEESSLVVMNGFEGIFRRRWRPSCFNYDIGKATAHVQAPRFKPSASHVRLYKLHGSISWFEADGDFFEENPSPESERVPLIIYPSRRKYTQSIRPPFDWLFRRFSAAVQESRLLVSIGYRFADIHLNQCIFAGLDNGLSILVLSKGPIVALESRSAHPQVSAISEGSTIIDGRSRPETTDLWAFERFANWLPALKER